MTIRAVGARDIDAWTAMRARLWPNADTDALAHETSDFIAGDPQAILAAAFVAAERERSPLGFIEVALRPFSDGCDSTPVPHVEGWYVEPAARGRGIGRLLMGAAETWASERGFTEIASDTEAGNEAAFGAHQACGFEEVERLIKFRKPISAITPENVHGEMFETLIERERW